MQNSRCLTRLNYSRELQISLAQAAVHVVLQDDLAISYNTKIRKLVSWYISVALGFSLVGTQHVWAVGPRFSTGSPDAARSDRHRGLGPASWDVSDALWELTYWQEGYLLNGRLP